MGTEGGGFEAGPGQPQRLPDQPMAEGQSNSGIAGRLVITERAVGKHINNIFAKLGLPADAEGHRRVPAVLEYLQNPA